MALWRGSSISATVSLSKEEYIGVRNLAALNGVTLSAYLRAIIVDALVEEGYDVQRRGTKGRQKTRETSQVSGGPAS